MAQPKTPRPLGQSYRFRGILSGTLEGAGRQHQRQSELGWFRTPGVPGCGTRRRWADGRENCPGGLPPFPGPGDVPGQLETPGYGHAATHPAPYGAPHGKPFGRGQGQSSARDRFDPRDRPPSDGSFTWRGDEGEISAPIRETAVDWIWKDTSQGKGESQARAVWSCRNHVPGPSSREGPHFY